LRAEIGLISLSIIIFLVAMLFEGVIFLPINSVLKVQIQTFTACLFMTSAVVLAIVGITMVFKRKF
jgi:hypothetical protein